MKLAIEILNREIAQRKLANKHDHLRKDISTQELKELESVVNLLSIPIVSGNYYWVKCFTDDKYEPTVAVDYYNNGEMHFKFLNGTVIRCKRISDYKELRV